jgi:phenylacetate-CoA ligase
MYTRLVSGLLFPVQERLKSHTTVDVRRRMEATQWWTPQQLAELQVERLRALLIEAANVPYWRDLFGRLRFDPRSVSSVADLRALPMLYKATIRQHIEAMKHPQARGLARFNTGGSSGEPLIFFIGNERVSHDVAAKWRATRWWNVDIGDPEIVVWGSPIELGSQDHVRAWRDKLMRTELIPAFEMSEAKLDTFIASIRRRRPRMLFGYPSALTRIAQHAVQRGQRMDDLGIRVAFVTSERLYDEQRATISRIFGCAVANGYGGRDAGFIAHECPQGGIHLTAEDVIVEIVGPDGQALPAGKAGEIVVTHLATRDFPFIRYRTGDVAVMDDRVCSCGRGLPMLREIQGRATDFVVATDGTVMHGLALIYILRDLKGLDAFKVTQHSLTQCGVELVTTSAFDPADVETIRLGFRRRLGDRVDVAVQFVDRIAPEASGKYRYIVSHVKTVGGTSVPPAPPPSPVEQSHA